MPYEIRLQDDPPMLQVTLGSVLAPGEIERLTAEVSPILDTVPKPVYQIVDARATHVDLGIILDGVKVAVRGINPVLLHPNIIESVVVTTDPLITMAVRGLNVPTFSNVKIHLCGTLDEALDYIQRYSRPAAV